MKKILLFTLCCTLCMVSAFAQSEIRESDLKGQWKMVFEFDEEDLEEDIEDSFWLGTLFSAPMSDFVMDILKDVDIYLEFQTGGKLKITVEAFDDHDVEYEKWRINRDGQLVIGDDDDDEVWMLEGRKLYQYEKKSRGQLERQEVFLVQQ